MSVVSFGDVVYVVGVIMTPAFFLSSLIVTNFVWLPMVHEGEVYHEESKRKEKVEEETVVTPYRYRYPLELAQRSLSAERELSELMSCLVVHKVPEGMVYMRYNSVHEGFIHQ